VRLRRLLSVAFAVGFAAITHPGSLFAQTDVIRGRITGPDSLPIERATVTVTSLSGNVSRSARTDKSGRYTVTFPGDEGDYFVNVAALGFATKRFEVKRTSDQEILIADARLQRVATQLDAVKVSADRQKAAQQARQNILNKFKAAPGPDDPEVKQRQAEREAQAAARAKVREAREAAKAEQKAREAEAAAAAAAQLAREKEEEAARLVALEAEAKAKRDARYAARKGGKGKKK